MKVDDTIIVINSSNRAGNVKTHSAFPEDYMKWRIAIPADQQEEYLKHHTKEELLVLPHYIPQYLSSQRQHIMELFARTNTKYVWLMDDDLTFFRRNEELKLRKCTPSDMKTMFETVRKHLNDVPMVGVSTRLGNNRIQESFVDITRVTRCYAMDANVFSEVGATFAPFEPFLAQDFHLTLCWLNAGYANRVIYSFAQEDVGSNAEGGVSTYRTPELLRKVSMWMADNHPEVNPVSKKSKGWDGFSEYRTDMIVQWKEAYKPKKVRGTGGLAARLARHTAKK